MFDQVVGNGANEFIIIVAILFGFVAALSFVDHKKVKEKEDQKEQGS